MAATVWKGFIGFGLVSFPVRLFSAARAEALHFHLLHKKDLSRVKEVWYCAQEDNEVDPVFFESSYYIGAESNTARPYVLFMAALANTKQDAIAKIAMHNREHIVLIRPSGGGLILHTLYYPDELHKANRSETPKAKYTAKELDLAKSLVGHLTAPFKPEQYKDTYRENVERLIKQKQKGQKITTVEQPAKAPVIDLMEALKRSLDAGKLVKATSKPRGQK